VSETCTVGGTPADLLHKSKRCDQLVSSILTEEVVALASSIRLYLNSMIHAWSGKPFLLSMIFLSCAATGRYLDYNVKPLLYVAQGMWVCYKHEQGHLVQVQNPSHKKPTAVTYELTKFWFLQKVSRDNSVGIVTRLRAAKRSIIFRFPRMSIPAPVFDKLWHKQKTTDRVQSITQACYINIRIL
jgi:hypothetical protein